MIVASSPNHSWISVLSDHALATPDREAFTFLLDGELQRVVWDYRKLDARARAIGAQLSRTCEPGARALLLYQPGPEFVAAFFGCLYAGVIAVPGYPPRSAEHERAMPRLAGILADAQPSIVLTATARMLTIVSECVGGLPCLDTETLPDALSAEWRKPAGIGQDTVAFLQYTSGSTSSPKGVVVSHGNLLHNAAATRDIVGHTVNSRGVKWLPPYHDMGLIGAILQPIFVGFPVTLMPPVAFLQRPLRWLKAMTEFKGTTGGGPDFAYDLCVRSIKPQDREGLDLSSWEIAFTGAEPVRRSTIDRFCEAYEPFGFRRAAFYPCYGLAEATLMVTGVNRLAGAVAHDVDAAALRNNLVTPPTGLDASSAQTLVGCGGAVRGTEVRVVDPQTLAECAANRVGEIWVRGGGVAQGYWKRTDATAETFAARIAGDADTRPWLRTGDLGFLAGGQLCVAGRMKDLIIIRGRNHHPNDIEHTAGTCHPALRAGGGAAFGVDVDGRERLVIVHEVERTQRDADPAEIFDAIRESVSRGHDLQTHAIVMLKPGRLLRTSSGKVRRHACREAFLANTDLGELGRWTAPEQADAISGDDELTTALPGVESAANAASGAAGQLEQWLAGKLAATLGVPVTEIDPAEPFARYGLDSANAVALSGEIATELNMDLEPTLFWDYPSVQALAGYLADATGEPQPPANRAA